VQIKLDRNPHGPGWQFRFVPFKRGAGYRAYDWPWHGHSIHDPWWRTRAWVSYIPGFTFTVTRRAKVYDKPRNGRYRIRPLFVAFKRNGNPRHFPAWW